MRPFLRRGSGRPSSWTQRRDTPYSRPPSLLDRPSATTAVITTLAIDIADHPHIKGSNDVAGPLRTMP